MAPSDLDDADDIMTRLPLVIPRGEVSVKDERYQYRSKTDQYFLHKAPVNSIDAVTGTSNGSSVSFVQGTDYALIDADNDGEDDSIDFSIGGKSPDDGTDFYVDYRADSVIARYVAAHDADVDRIETRIDNTIKSAQVSRADGAGANSDLSRIGALFGRLGQKQNRNEEEYRIYLQSIVQSFKGRGTKPGMKFAIASAIGTDTDNVTINEDYQQVGYEIQIDSSVNTTVISSVINEMAELADPSGVELLSEPIIVVGSDSIEIDSTDTSVTSSSTGLSSGTLNMDGTSTLS